MKTIIKKFFYLYLISLCLSPVVLYIDEGAYSFPKDPMVYLSLFIYAALFSILPIGLYLLFSLVFKWKDGLSFGLSLIGFFHLASLIIKAITYA
jgi:hypothetical protein